MQSAADTSAAAAYKSHTCTDCTPCVHVGLLKLCRWLLCETLFDWNMSARGGTPYIGSKISLLSMAQIRYEGTLSSVDTDRCTVALAKGKPALQRAATLTASCREFKWFILCTHKFFMLCCPSSEILWHRRQAHSQTSATQG